MAEGRYSKKPNKDYNDSYRYTEERGRRPSKAQQNNQNFEDISSNTDPNHKKNNYRAPNGKKSGLKRILVVICSLVLLIGGVMIFISFYFLNGLTTTSIAKSPQELGIMDGIKTDKSIKNIALFGIDKREGEGGYSRSDAIMVISVDNKHNKVKMTSVLRDSLVAIDEYGDDKINHAYAFGGPQLAIKTLNKNFSLDIEDFVTVDFNQMTQIVDAFGGTEIEITSEETYQINQNLDLLKADEPTAVVVASDYLDEGFSGVKLLNGNQAVAFARNRADGDDQRAIRQQKVLKGLVARIKSIKKTDYPGVIRDIMPLCETSLDFGDILGISPIALSNFELESISIPDEIDNATDGHTDAGGAVFVFDLEYAGKHINAFIYESDSPSWPEFKQYFGG